MHIGNWIQKLLGTKSSTTTSPGGDSVDFKMIAENSVDVILRTDSSMRANYISPSSLHVLGWKPEELIGRSPADFILPEYLPLIAAAQAKLESGDEDQNSVSFEVRKKDGSTLWVKGNAQMIHDADPAKNGGAVIIMRDISEHKRLEEELSKLARHDGLTGLANRRAFDEALEIEWRRTLQKGTPISLLLLDVDHFKEFNDQYGHQVGDDCLRAISRAVQSAMCSDDDLVARYGGEEIAVVLPGSDQAEAIDIAEKVLSSILALQLPHTGNPEGNNWVTASIGVATALSRTGGTMNMPEGLLVAADGALYKAKHGGRNRAAATLVLAPDQSP